MAKKKSEIKQNQKQTINITIGDKAIKRRRGRPRKRQAKSKESGFVVQHTFTAPIINYPPSYVNPAVVQPIQQPQSATLVPKPPVGAPPKQARATVFPEGETAPLLGLSATNPNELKLEKGEPASKITPFSTRLAEASQQAKLEQFSPPKPLKKSKAKPQPTAENALGGRDTNKGDAYEPDTGLTLAAAQPSLPPIGQRVTEWIPPGRGARSRRSRPEGIRPPDFSPPPIAVRLNKDGSPDKRSKGYRQAIIQAGQASQEAVEPLAPPPDEGIRFLGSSRPTEASPPSIERQRGEGITQSEATFLSA